MGNIFILEIASCKTAGEKIDKSENKSYLLARNQTRRQSHDSKEFKQGRC